MKETPMLTKLYSESRLGIKDMIATIRRYEDPETRLQMSEFEKNQNASMMFVLPIILAAAIPTTVAWLLVPDISKLMGLPMGSSIFASPTIPVVIAVVLAWAYIGQKIVQRRVKLGYLAFVTVTTFIAAYGGWTFYLLKLKLDANPGLLG